MFNSKQSGMASIEITTSDFTYTMFFITGLQVYSLLVVYSYYRELKEEVPTVPWVVHFFIALYLLYLRTDVVKRTKLINRANQKY